MTRMCRVGNARRRKIPGLHPHISTSTSTSTSNSNSTSTSTSTSPTHTDADADADTLGLFGRRTPVAGRVCKLVDDGPDGDQKGYNVDGNVEKEKRFVGRGVVADRVVGRGDDVFHLIDVPSEGDNGGGEVGDDERKELELFLANGIGGGGNVGWHL